MSESYIPPFPGSNASGDTQYTLVFENARAKRQSGGAPEPVANPKTPPNQRNREPDPPRVTASPLHHLQPNKSPMHHQGSSGNGSRGSGRSGSSKPANPNYQSYPSPKPSTNIGGGKSHEGQIGYNTPGRNTPSRNKKKPAEQVYDDLLPPFPSDNTDTNYTEVFARYRKDNMSPLAPAMKPYSPSQDTSPKMKRCSCFGL